MQPLTTSLLVLLAFGCASPRSPAAGTGTPTDAAWVVGADAESEVAGDAGAPSDAASAAPDAASSASDAASDAAADALPASDVNWDVASDGTVASDAGAASDAATDAIVDAASDVATDSGVAADALPAATVIEVHHPLAASIALRGDTPPLSWATSLAAAAVAGTIATFVLPVAAADIEVKAVLELAGEAPQWQLGPNHVVAPAEQRDLFPYFDPLAAAGRREDFTVAGPVGAGYKAGKRTVRVFLPPGYDENSAASYPLVVMFDGQNLFEDETASFGVSWQLDEAALAMVAAAKSTELVIAGVDHGGDRRIFEYTPSNDPAMFGGDNGGGDGTLDWLDATVLPELEKRYRLLSGRDNRAVGGSSLGGLMAMHALWTRPDKWSSAIAMSGSWWWNDGDLFAVATKLLPLALPSRVWLDAGTVNDNLALAQQMKAALVAGGFAEAETLGYYEAVGADHSESAWKDRAHLPIAFLFDPGDRTPAFK